MRELLKDLYFGNIVPSARQITRRKSLTADESQPEKIFVHIRLRTECAPVHPWNGAHFMPDPNNDKGERPI